MQTVTFTRTLARQAVAALALVAIILSLVPVQALAIDAQPLNPIDTANDCEIGYVGFKIDETADSLTEGIYVSGDFSVNISNVMYSNENEVRGFDFSNASPAVSYVFLKGGQSDVTENYDPAGATADTGLAHPKSISHISFCYAEIEVTTTLTLEKDTAGDGAGVAADWKLTAAGPFEITGNGQASETFTESEFDAFASPRTWTLSEERVNPLNPNSENYVAGNWSCDGGTLSGDEITLEKGDDVTCTITNTYTPPVLGCMDSGALNFKVDANKDDGSCQYMCAYSDAGTTIDGNPSVLTYVHANWTDEFDDTPAEWIWDTAQVTTPNPQNLTFTKTFFSPVATNGELKIAVDNFYTATLNGNALPAGCTGATGNNHSTADVCDVSVQAGINTLVINATNGTGPVNYQSNPAGVIFTMTTENDSCVPVADLGSITIVKEVAGGYVGDWSFGFTGDLGAFNLSDDEHSQTFTNLVPDEYLVNETIPAGWADVVVSCDDQNSGPGQGEDMLVVALDEGEDVTCTVTNRKAPAPACEAPNLLVNGSFEEPVAAANSHNGGFWEVFPSITGWAATNGIEVWRNMMGGASEGEQNLELDVDGPTKVTQSVPVTLGSTYKLSFDFSSRPDADAAANNVVDASLDGTVVLTAAGDGTDIATTDWATYETTFTATGNSVTVGFEDMGVPTTGTGSLLDNAVLCLVDEPEPETITFEGSKYNDKNGNGVIDEDEEIIEGWEFELYYDGELELTTATGEDGRYEFIVELEEGIDPLLFEVKEVMPNENSGWEMTALYVNDVLTEAQVCQLPLESESLTLDCDFLNHKDTPVVEEDRPGNRTTGTRTNRGRSGQVAGASTSIPEGSVLGEQISIVPLGAAAAGAGGAAPVELPASNLLAAAFGGRRK